MVMVVVAVIPLAASFLVANLILRQESVESARERVSAINSALSADLTRTAENMQASLKALADSSVVSQRDSPLGIVQLQLQEFQRTFTPFEDLTLLDLGGRVLASSSYLYVGDWEHSQVYQAAVAGHSAMSDILVIPGREGLFHSHAVSVSDSSGQWGVLVGVMPNAGFNRAANEAHIGDGGLAFLANSHGRFLSHPEPARILERWNEGATLLSAEGKGTAWLPLLGRDSLCAYTTIPIPDKVGEPWEVVSCQSKSVILEAATSTQEVLIWAILGSLGFAVLAALMLSRRLTIPIYRLVQGVRKFQGGDLTSQIEPRTSDEIADVAMSFNSMAATLADKIGELEHAEVELKTANQELEIRVEERTLELSSANEKMRIEIAERKQKEVQLAELLEELSVSRRQLRGLSRSLVEAQEAERRSIALELHDEVGQVITGVQLMLEIGKRSAGDGLRARLAVAQEVLGKLMDQIRELSLDLRPAMLDDLGLLPTLKWYFERYTFQTNIKVSLRTDNLEVRLPIEVETAAFRIVQEALTNVARHSGATKAAVTFETDREKFLLHIEDKGSGFDAKDEQLHNSGGLLGMRERALLLGGGLSVDSVPGVGTSITAELPINRPREHTYGQEPENTVENPISLT